MTVEIPPGFEFGVVALLSAGANEGSVGLEEDLLAGKTQCSYK